METIKICWKTRKPNSTNLVKSTDQLNIMESTLQQLYYVPDRLKDEVMYSEKLLRDVFNDVYYCGAPIEVYHGKELIGSFLQSPKTFRYKHFSSVVDKDRNVPVLCFEDTLLLSISNNKEIKDMDAFLKKLAAKGFTEEELKKLRPTRKPKKKINCRLVVINQIIEPKWPTIKIKENNE